MIQIFVFFFLVGSAANQPSNQRNLERSSQPLTNFALPSTSGLASGAKTIPPKSLPISNTETQLKQGHQEIQSENVQSSMQSKLGSNVSAQTKAQESSNMGKYLHSSLL